MVDLVIVPLAFFMLFILGEKSIDHCNLYLSARTDSGLVLAFAYACRLRGLFLAMGRGNRTERSRTKILKAVPQSYDDNSNS